MGEFNPERFIRAQEGVYSDALRELHTGHKQSHWMWFIFPQLAGLGHSSTARYYALDNLDQARAYLRHPLLGARLRECTSATLAIDGRTVDEIFGPVDALKFRSSLTLFSRAAGDESLFARALAKFCTDEDQRTLALLDLQ